ncbi:hypothetical protein COBT_001135 [Conglomerata obtusa]
MHQRKLLQTTVKTFGMRMAIKCAPSKKFYTKVAVESHNSNFRIGRVIRTVREGLLKQKIEYCKRS